MTRFAISHRGPPYTPGRSAPADDAEGSSGTPVTPDGARRGEYEGTARDGRLAALSLRTRVSVLAALAVGLAVALTSGAAFLTVRTQMYQALDANLLNRARAAVASPLGDPSRLVKVPAAALGAADVRIGLIRANGTAYSARGAADAPPLGRPELAVARGLADKSVRTATIAAGEFRVVAVPAGPGLALVLAQSTARTEATLARLGLVLLVVGTIGVAVAAYAGLVVARAALRPVHRLTAAAEHVARTQEPRPIAVEGAQTGRGSDELGRLAGAFNAMLTALAESRETQRRLVADAEHELRTPMTSLRTNLDLLAQSDREGGMAADDRAELLADVRAQTDELSGLVSDLVELAREDPPEQAHESVDLGEIVTRAAQRVRRRAPEVTLDVHTHPHQVWGDTQALTRAATNLLDNAAKWSPASGTVTVRQAAGIVTVADQGPGISPVDLPYVFDRFYRATEARGMPGSGLGLAIVEAVARRHGGTVTAHEAPGGGALLRLRLPARW